MKLPHFILDVDGVLTDGSFHYSVQGKAMKVFGAHDHDGLKLIKDMVNIQFITADKRGFDITNQRVNRDMGFPLTLVSESARYEYVQSFGFENVIFMGDGYHDAPILRACWFGIAPANAWDNCLLNADIVTKRRGGDGAVMEACLAVQRFLASQA